MGRAYDFLGNPIPDENIPQMQGYNPTAAQNQSSGAQQSQPPPPAPQPQYNPGNPRMPDIVAQVVEERMPIPSFPMIVTTIDKVARKIPWFVWLGLGAALCKLVPQIAGKWLGKVVSS